MVVVVATTHVSMIATVVVVATSNASIIETVIVFTFSEELLPVFHDPPLQTLQGSTFASKRELLY